MAGPELSIDYLEVGQLRPYPNNARTHSKKQIRQIAESMAAFGFTNPILIDDQNTIIAGHGRAAAAKQLGIVRVPCVRLSSMTDEQKRCYVIADNKLALNAGWDDEILAKELQGLLECVPNLDIGLSGFSIAEVDLLIESVVPDDASNPADDRLPVLDPGRKATSRCGDLWLLGLHRVLCADCTDADAVQVLLAGEKAQMVFTDPPYNVPINGHVSGLGRTKHQEFAMASGEMSSAQFEQFLAGVFSNLIAASVAGSIHFICMDWRHLGEVLAAGGARYSELKNVCVWVKDNGGMGSFYRSRHEMILAFKSGTAPHLNTFELGQHGRYRTNVWEYRGLSSRSSERQEALALHPTVKPVGLVADAIRDVSERAGIVLDCFGGSGSTLIAAHKTGRRARLIEIDPIYVDRAIRRWEAYAHDDAVLAGTGQTFAQLAVERGCAEGNASA